MPRGSSVGRGRAEQRRRTLPCWRNNQPRRAGCETLRPTSARTLQHRSQPVTLPPISMRATMQHARAIRALTARAREERTRTSALLAIGVVTALPSPPPYARRFATAAHMRIDEVKVFSCYSTLSLPVGSDAQVIRQRYLELAKRLHPDVTDGGASEEFTQAQEAYTYLVGLHGDVLARTKREAEDRTRGYAQQSSEPVPNAAHANIVQHRQYLRNEGVGDGHDPMRRDRQYRSHRASRGHEGALDYQNSKLMADLETAHDSQATKDLAAYDSLLSLTRANGVNHIDHETLVEEQIKAAIKQWDPSSFKDFGKPLEHLERDSGSGSPLEAKLNAILHANGVVPDWLDLERTITTEHAASIEEMKFVWNELVSEQQFIEGRRRLEAHDPASLASVAAVAALPPFPSKLQPVPVFSSIFGPAWSLALNEFHSSLRSINSSIDDFNCSVPRGLDRQRVHFAFHDEVADLEKSRPDHTLRGQFGVRERDVYAVLRRSSGGSSTVARKNLLGSSRIAATMAGGADHYDTTPQLRATHVTDPFATSVTTTADLRAENMSGSEIEELYRSLSPMPRLTPEELEARRKHAYSKHQLPFPPAVLVALGVASSLLFALPLWLASRRTKRAQEAAAAEA